MGFLEELGIPGTSSGEYMDKGANDERIRPQMPTRGIGRAPLARDMPQAGTPTEAWTDQIYSEDNPFQSAMHPPVTQQPLAPITPQAPMPDTSGDLEPQLSGIQPTHEPSGWPTVGPAMSGPAPQLGGNSNSLIAMLMQLLQRPSVLQQQQDARETNYWDEPQR